MIVVGNLRIADIVGKHLEQRSEATWIFRHHLTLVEHRVIIRNGRDFGDFGLLNRS